MFKSALEEWNAMYCRELEDLWKSQQTEFRGASMMLYTLKRQFKSIEDVLDKRLNNLKNRHKLELKKSPKKVSPKTTQKNNLDASFLNNSTLLYQVDKSPTIKQSHKRKKLVRPSVSKLDFSADNCHNLPKLSSNKHDEGDSVIVSDSSFEEMSFNLLCPQKKRPNISSTVTLFKTPLRDTSLDDNLADSPLIIASTPQTMKPRRSNSNYGTLTQMFADMRNQKSPQKTLNDSDETFFESFEKAKPKSKNMPFEDYDNFVVDSPELVQKPARRKADKMKLPGWSCNDCKRFYEGLNLSSQELREKMNACSKHRGKIKPTEDTFKKFWDLALTPDDDTE